MDIEQLTKSQIVLLTLLVSFMTSIATGIVTVSLMDQAPPVVAQSVSRVIERTIQTVASSTPKAQAATTVVTQEKTVVVKESDLISTAVKNATPSLVRVTEEGTDGPLFIGLGFVLDATGDIATDASALGDAPDATVTLSDGTHLRAFVVSRDDAVGVAYLRAATTTADGKSVTFDPIGITTDRPILGQTVVLLTGRSSMRIAGGLVTALSGGEKSPLVVQSDVSSDLVLPGSFLIDTSGSLVGISTGVSRQTASSGFIAGSALMKGTTAEKK